MKRLIALALIAIVAGVVAIPAFGATKNVTVGDNFFRPANTTVSKNTTVRWRWRGSAPHNVTVTSGPRRFASTTKSSGTYSRKMTRRGTYRITCTIHAGMNMRLRVR